MTVTTNLKTELQARLNAVTSATTIIDLIRLRRAARGLFLDETVLNNELSQRIANNNGATTLDELFQEAIALPVQTPLSYINEIRPFFSDKDSFTDIYGGIWLRAGVITYDAASYPDANKLPVINNDASAAPTPVAQPALSGITPKRVASNGSVVVAINSAGTSLTRWSGDFTTVGTTISGASGALSGSVWVSITWDARLGVFVMIGRGSTKMVKSTDGTNWTVVTLPASPPNWSADANALVFAGSTKFHLFILNKHWTSDTLAGWTTQADIAAPNADGETLVLRDLRGAVETSNGQTMLWGNYWSTSLNRQAPFISVSETFAGLGCSFSLSLFNQASDMVMQAAAARSATDFEVWVQSSANTRIGAVISRVSAGVFSVVAYETGMNGMDTTYVPQHAVNYQGLIIRVSSGMVTAFNMARQKPLPYNQVGTYASQAMIRSGGGLVLIRIGNFFYQVGNGNGVSAFDFKWMVGLPAAAPLDGASAATTGSYAAHFVRIK